VLPYTYFIVNTSTGIVYNATDGLFTNLPSGEYNAFVYDSNNCHPNCLNVQFSVDSSVSPLNHIPIITYNCNNQSGHTINITASSGSQPYLYSVGGAFSQSGVFSNLSPGTYQTNVLDAVGCLSVLSISINAITPVVVQVTQLSHEYCGSGNGSITLNANGGTPPYNFTLYNSSQQVVGTNSSGLFSGLSAGNYSYVVTDANGCSNKINCKKIKVLNKCKPCLPNNHAIVQNASDNEVLLWPNPVTNKVNVKFNIPEVELVDLLIVDMSGKNIFELKSLENESNVEIDLEGYNSGTYLVNLLNENGELIQTERLLIIK
jgi:hypothetical protein